MPKTHRKPLSRFFPAYHPKAGLPTYFVEKLLSGLDAIMPLDLGGGPLDKYCEPYEDLHKYEPKYHTIRGGNKVKVGDFIQFYCWVGKPYRSKQIVVAPPIEVKKVWNFDIDLISPTIFLDGQPILRANEFRLPELTEIAKNDGLELEDLLLWLKFPQTGIYQIICWNEKLEY